MADSINRYINASSYAIAVKDPEPPQGEIISGNIQLTDLLKDHDVTKGNDDNMKYETKDLVDAMKDAENLINPSYDVD